MQPHTRPHQQTPRGAVSRDAVEAMIARVALQDREAFAALYDATAGKLFAVCMSVLGGDRGEAEEVLQDAYLRVWNHAGRYSVNGLSPMTWLITIARNLAIDRRRRRIPARGTGPAGPAATPPRREVGTDVLAGIACPGPSPEDAAIATGERARLADCLSKLDAQRSAAVRAVYLDGASYADVARDSGIPINTVRTWLRRSLLRLRDCVAIP